MSKKKKKKYEDIFNVLGLKISVLLKSSNQQEKLNKTGKYGKAQRRRNKNKFMLYLKEFVVDFDWLAIELESPFFSKKKK